MLNEHVPLQKGLRLYIRKGLLSVEALNEHVPLQKGLRLSDVKAVYPGHCASMSMFHYKKD